jgi:hypothetical protein
MALEEELQRMGAMAREALQVPLDSQRNLARAAEKLGELAAIDERLQPLLKGLMTAVSDLVKEQQAQAEALAGRAEELRRRRDAYEALLARYGGLGKSALELNELVRAFASGAAVAAQGGRAAEGPSLENVQETMGKLVESAAEVAQAARNDDFEDLAAQADALRQQLLAARNKLGLLAARHERGAVQ